MSSFSKAELPFIEGINNDTINAKFLANYDKKYQPPLPMPNTDQKTLTAFLERKYVKKAWYSDSNASTDS